MGGVFADQELSAQCPECGATVTMSIGEARKSPTRSCPNDHTIEFEATDLDRKLKDTERRIKNLFD